MAWLPAQVDRFRPVLVGVTTAGEVLDGFAKGSFLHAGPPLDWADMSAPMRGAVLGAALFEGIADDPDEVARRAGSGEFEFSPGHERGGLGPMAGVVSPSMPVWIVENATHGNRTYCTFSEGLGEMLRFGAYGPWVVERLHWMASVLYPVMAEALARLDEPIDLRQITAEAV